MHGRRKWFILALDAYKVNILGSLPSQDDCWHTVSLTQYILQCFNPKYPASFLRVDSVEEEQMASEGI